MKALIQRSTLLPLDFPFNQKELKVGDKVAISDETYYWRIEALSDGQIQYTHIQPAENPYSNPIETSYRGSLSSLNEFGPLDKPWKFVP